MVIHNTGMSAKNIAGLDLTIRDMLSVTGTIKTFYLNESNMTTSAYKDSFGQAIVMTDYLAAGMRFGSIEPTIFYLPGSEWLITRPSENYKRLPLFLTGKFFNRFCKGHVLYTEFITNDIITNSNGQKINWEPLGAYAYNLDENLSLLLINRDFVNPFTIQIALPEGVNYSTNATMYSIWNGDFSSVETNINSGAINLTHGMLVTIPRHSMVIIATQVQDVEFSQLPHGYFDRVHVESLNTWTDAGRFVYDEVHCP